MRARETSYDDYGVENERQIMEHARSGGFVSKMNLLRIAGNVYPEIAADLFNSILYGWSYDKLSGMHEVAINRNDFYAYRRRVIYEYGKEAGMV